jgi:hypothetical protein
MFLPTTSEAISRGVLYRSFNFLSLKNLIDTVKVQIRDKNKQNKVLTTNKNYQTNNPKKPCFRLLLQNYYVLIVYYLVGYKLDLATSFKVVKSSCSAQNNAYQRVFLPVCDLTTLKEVAKSIYPAS